MGLSQGSGLAAAGFQALSTVMVEGYKSMGHGCRYVSAITATIFSFAAVLYVDDTDLLMKAADPDAGDKKFFHEVQTAIDDWCGLVRASGGSCRADKCYASIGLFNFTETIAVRD